MGLAGRRWPFYMGSLVNIARMKLLFISPELFSIKISVGLSHSRTPLREESAGCRVPRCPRQQSQMSSGRQARPSGSVATKINYTHRVTRATIHPGEMPPPSTTNMASRTTFWDLHFCFPKKDLYKRTGGSKASAATATASHDRFLARNSHPAWVLLCATHSHGRTIEARKPSPSRPLVRLPTPYPRHEISRKRRSWWKALGLPLPTRWTCTLLLETICQRGRAWRSQPSDVEGGRLARFARKRALEIPGRGPQSWWSLMGWLRAMPLILGLII